MRFKPVLFDAEIDKDQWNIKEGPEKQVYIED